MIDAQVLGPRLNHELWNVLDLRPRLATAGQHGPCLDRPVLDRHAVVVAHPILDALIEWNQALRRNCHLLLRLIRDRRRELTADCQHSRPAEKMNQKLDELSTLAELEFRILSQVNGTGLDTNDRCVLLRVDSDDRWSGCVLDDAGVETGEVVDEHGHTIDCVEVAA